MNQKKIKITFNKPRVYVDEQTQSSKCGLTGVLYIPKEVAQHIGMPEYTKVIAKSQAACRRGDVFSVEKARKIAIAKAEIKMYEKVSEKIVRMWDKFNDVEVPADLYDMLQDAGVFPTLNTAINEFWQKAENVMEHNTRYIEEIGG